MLDSPGSETIEAPDAADADVWDEESESEVAGFVGEPDDNPEVSEALIPFPEADVSLEVPVEDSVEELEELEKP
ncbi:hypothetical protein WICMUC_003714, partial [Wickerhamomyces mucosus]